MLLQRSARTSLITTAAFGEASSRLRSSQGDADVLPAGTATATGTATASGAGGRDPVDDAVSKLSLTLGGV